MSPDLQSPVLRLQVYIVGFHHIANMVLRTCKLGVRPTQAQDIGCLCNCKPPNTLRECIVVDLMRSKVSDDERSSCSVRRLDARQLPWVPDQQLRAIES